MPKCIALASRVHATRLLCCKVHAALFMLPSLGAAWARVEPNTIASETAARRRVRRGILGSCLGRRADMKARKSDAGKGTCVTGRGDRSLVRLDEADALRKISSGCSM